MKSPAEGLFHYGDFSLNKEKLSKNQLLLFSVIAALITILKVILFPCNMMSGEAVTRVWNALWWSQNPFVILPDMNHPLYYYLMGTVIMIFREIYYVPIFTSIIIVTIGSIYLFKISYLIADYKTALLAFFIFTFNPASFRLNFDPHPYSLTPLFYTVTVYYLLLAFFGPTRRKYFLLAGLFSFLASSARPEAIFIILCFCCLAFLSKKKGYTFYIIPALLFQVFWVILSLFDSGTLFATFRHAAEYPNIFDIHGLNLALRLKGFFLPYYYLFTGMTLLIFYFFLKGIYLTYKGYPKIILIVLVIPILIPALTNGTASVWATIFNSTFYIFPMFYFGSVFAAIGLDKFLSRTGNRYARIVIASLIIISAIPLSFIKEFVPQKFKGLFPRVVEFFETAPEPSEVKTLCGVIDEHIGGYPSLILDDEGVKGTGTLYLAYRTKLAPPEKILITTYQTPPDMQVLRDKVIEFISKNRKGIILTRNSPTLFNRILNESNNPFEGSIELILKTEHWSAYLFKSDNQHP